ncbi:hypothetical protein [Sphingomonas sp.]|jgi:hypothetical protein|uniref:hypothetical protein n=1 Tax=Sphingomonas sp. TaxID=28214 RepID=UPI002EDB004B
MSHVAFRPVVLDAGHGDQDAMLVLRDDRLTMVLSCLGEMHGELAGRWFVEAVFADTIRAPHETFATLEAVEAWLVALS